jgi:hypothetical protein
VRHQRKPLQRLKPRNTLRLRPLSALLTLVPQRADPVRQSHRLRRIRRQLRNLTRNPSQQIRTDFSTERWPNSEPSSTLKSDKSLIGLRHNSGGGKPKSSDRSHPLRRKGKRRRVVTTALRRETERRGTRGRSLAEHRGRRDSRRLLRQLPQNRHLLTRHTLQSQHPARSPNSGRLSSTTRTCKGEVQGEVLQQEGEDREEGEVQS